MFLGVALESVAALVILLEGKALFSVGAGVFYLLSFGVCLLRMVDCMKELDEATCSAEVCGVE